MASIFKEIPVRPVVPCPCMAREREDGSIQCKTCWGDWYACDCVSGHSKACLENEQYVDCTCREVQLDFGPAVTPSSVQVRIKCDVCKGRDNVR